jgi:hypothetical protein
MMNHRWLASFFIALCLVAGCNSGGKKQNSTDMRVLHASLDTEPLDILVDNDVKAAAVAFGSTTGYSNFDSGTRTVTLRAAGTQNTLLTKTLGFASGVSQTLVVYGPRASLSAQVVIDDATDPASGNFKVRVIGLSADIGPVDVYLTTSDIAAVPAAITNVVYGSATSFVELPSGTFPFSFASAGTKQPLFRSGALNFAAGSINTLLVFPAYSGALVNAGVLTSGSDASGTFLGNGNARLKIANAVADSNQFNFVLDGTPLFSNATYKGVTSYATATAGDHTLFVRASAVPGSNVASLATRLDPARDYSIVVLGSMAQLQTVRLLDDNTLPSAGLAKVRFVNANVAGGNVDALVDFGEVQAGISPGTASPYAPIPSGDTHVVTFTTPGGVNAIATVNSVQLLAGGVYSIYLFGTAPTVDIRVTRDR